MSYLSRQQLWDGTDVADVNSYESVNSLVVSPGHTKTFITTLRADNITAAAGYMLVDLSDTTNWPHTNTGHIDIAGLHIAVQGNTAFRGDITVGFLSSVDATDGDFNQLMTWHFQLTGDTTLRDHLGVGALREIACEVGDWFGATTANDTTWQTDVNLYGPDGTTAYPAGAGDLVAKLEITAGNVDFSILVAYETRA